MRRRLSPVALLVLAVFVSGAGGPIGAPAGSAVAAGAAAGWQQVTTLFSGDLADHPDIAGDAVTVDGQGKATAVWDYGSLEDSQGEWNQAVMTADWTATGGWTTPQTLAPPAATAGANVVFGLQLAGNARGDAVATWLAGGVGGDSSVVQAAFRPAGQAWQPAQTISPPAANVGGLGGPPQTLAIDGRGRVLVMWSVGNGLQVVARTTAGVWGKPKVLCDCVDSGDALAMNASGQALAVWGVDRGVRNPSLPRRRQGLWVDVRAPAGRWSMPKRISPLVVEDCCLLALNARSTAVVAWHVYSSGNDHLTIVIRPAHGRFGQAQPIGNDSYFGESLALAPNGEAVVMWSSLNDCCVYAMARAPGASTFSSEQSVTPGGWAVIVGSLSMDAQGNALALWTRQGANGRIYIHAAQRPAGGSFDSGSDIADIGPGTFLKDVGCQGSPAIANNPTGGAVAIWLANATADQSRPCSTVQAATFQP